MSCLRCQELQSRVGIRTPGELGKVIRVVQANLRDGTLDEVPSGGPFASANPFPSLKENGPWDDVVSYDFRCRSCGAGFHLSAETYHGAGGEWAPVKRDVPA